MNTALALLPALILASSLAACSGEEKPQGSEQAASGEVLKGSISDDMLPYDTLRSQPPLANAEPSEDAESAADASTADTDQPDPGPGTGQAPADSLPDRQPADE